MLIGISVLASMLSACSSGTKTRPESNPELQAHLEIDSSIGATQRGLEVRVLTVNDTGDRVAEALSMFQHEHGTMDELDRARWNAWGFRWVVVPADRVDSILGMLELTKATQIRWMGEFPRWRPVIRTGELRNETVRIGEPNEFQQRSFSGRPRLLARVWTAPEVTDEGVLARLHLDLAIQISDSSSRSSGWEAPKFRTAMDDGYLIEELKMSQSLDSSSAIILVGEDPSVRWLDPENQSSSSVVVNDQSPIGPRSGEARTLGQRMLSAPGTGYVEPGKRYVSPKKVLLVIVPKAGGSFRLLGPSSPTQSQGNQP